MGSLGTFLGSVGSPASPKRLRHRPQAHVGGAFHNPPPYGGSRGRPEPRPATLLRHPFGQAPSRRCRNVCLLCIGYAFRPRLSSRLTLGGLALPRKPWAYGGGVSRAALVTHASILAPLRSTVGRPPASPRRGRSPTDEEFIPPLRRHA